MKRILEKNKRLQRRKLSIRKKIKGTADRPRMTVYKSNTYLYVQVIDDVAGTTIASASTLDSDLKGLKRNVEDAAKLGEAIGDRLKQKKITSVVFDRNGNLFHGIVKSIADGARKAGIEF